MLVAAIITVCLLALAFLVWASADISSNVYVRTFSRGPKDRRTIALTFDDGPHPEMTPKVLDVLRKNEVKATFFLVGKNVEKYPELAERIAREGHVIANHGFTHTAKPLFMSGEKAADELMQCRDAAYMATGRKPRLYRPPFGVTSPNLGMGVRQAGMECVGWSIRSYDTLGSIPREKVVRRVMDRMHEGAVVLLHDRCEGEDIMLEQLISRIREEGYGFETIDKMMNADVYEND